MHETQFCEITKKKVGGDATFFVCYLHKVHKMKAHMSTCLHISLIDKFN
jgi:hypothetical protein